MAVQMSTEALMTQVVVEQAIVKEIEHLDQEDVTSKATALAGIVVLLSQVEGVEVPQQLVTRLPMLYALLDSQDLNLQRNACALLTALLGISEELWQKLIDEGLVDHLVAQLSGTADATFQLNLLAALTEAMRGGDQGGHSVVDCQGFEHILRMTSSEDQRVQEAAADAVCCLLTQVDLRAQLPAKEIVDKMVPLVSSPAAEVRVRSLMSLGMLLPHNPELQQHFAETQGAVAGLLAAIKQNEDADSKIIARDLFALLAQNPQCKQHLEDALRSRT